MSYSLSVVVPVYNGAHLLQDFLKQISSIQQQGVLEVIVVNDGSQSWPLQEEKIKRMYRDLFLVSFIHHGKNRGKGAAIRSGMSLSQGTHILMLDVDWATHTESVRNLIQESKKDPFSMVCGSRYMEGGKVQRPQKRWRQRAGSFGAHVIKVLFSISQQDTQCGAKIFPEILGKEIVSEAKCNRWAADVEWFVLAQKKSHLIKFVPVTWSDGGLSQVKPWHFVTTAWDILMIRLRM